MKALALASLAVVALAGCASNGYSSDVIVRVYFQEWDGCLDADGYSGWSIQLKNDHPTTKSRNSYQIRDSMVDQAQAYAESGQRVSLTVKGSNFDSDCDRVTKIEAIPGAT